MEKRKRSYDLEDLKRRFANIAQLGQAITGTAFRNAQELGFSREDIINTIQSLKPTNFYKSMTSNADHRIWQDVYHVKFNGIMLYVKFTKTPNGDAFLLSFKEK